MEQFTKELNELLTKYPDLPEFSLTVRPRLSIEIKSAIKSVIPQISVTPVPMLANPLDPTSLNVDVAKRIKDLGLKEVVQNA